MLAKAIAEYREAVRLRPSEAIFRNNLGLALRAKGDLIGAIAEHREAARLDPKSVKAHRSLAEALFKKGDLGGAIGEPGIEEALDVAIVRHADRPPTTTARASASRAARMARWALNRRYRAVPGGMPRVSAISEGAYPR